MVVVQLSCGGTLMLCIFGLLIWGGIELSHATESFLDVKNTSSTSSGDVTSNNSPLYTKINDVIRSFGDVTPQRFLPNVEYIQGDLDLVLAAPHGGYLTPFYMPDRDAGCYVQGKCVFRHKCQPKDFDECKAVVEHDDLTRELTFLIAYEIKKLIGRQPHLVLNNLDRIKLDPNRERNEATFNVPPTVFAFRKYHRSIEKAKRSFQGPGLVLDIHGHGHEIQRTELGYQITGDDLDKGILDPSKSCVRSLAGRVNISFEELILGPKSLGGLFVNKGYRAVPSPEETGPGGEKYFYGLYDTIAHGSLKGGNVDAIMVESAQAYRRPEVILTYAKDFAQIVVEYMRLYYNLQVPGDFQTASKDNDPKNENNYQGNVNALGLDDFVPPGNAVMAEVDNYISPAKVVIAKDIDVIQPVRTFSAKAYNDSPPEIGVSVPDDNDDYSSHRLPVRLSLGIFVMALALTLIAGVWYWNVNRQSRLSGYVSLNGGQYPLNSL